MSHMTAERIAKLDAAAIAQCSPVHIENVIKDLMKAAIESLAAPSAASDAADDAWTRGQMENRDFHEWWESSGQKADHDLRTENAAHATWQERASRAAISASKAAPKTALTPKRIHEIAHENGMYEQHDNAKPSSDTVEAFARAIEDAAAPNAQLVEAAQSAYSYLFATGLKTKHPAEFQTCSHLSDKLRHALAAAGVSPLPQAKEGA